jgi:hypothetical protein
VGSSVPPQAASTSIKTSRSAAVQRNRLGIKYTPSMSKVKQKQPYTSNEWFIVCGDGSFTKKGCFGFIQHMNILRT